MRALVLAVFLAASLLAVDSASFRYLGASRSRSHAAWLSFGVQDGSGFPWAVLEIMTTSPYRVLELHRVLISEESSSGVVAVDSAMVLAAASLQRYSIMSEYGGQVLLDHKLTDAGVSPDTVEFAMESFYTWYPGITYTMVLEQLPSGITERDADWFPEPVLPKLTMTDGRSRALVYRESQAPDEYRLCFAYRIAKVIRLSGNTLLVVFNVMEPGFEGPNLRYRVLAVDFPLAWRQ